MNIFNNKKELINVGQIPKNSIIMADCFDVMIHIPDNSVDMILCDLPYGITKNSWDSVLPLDDLWKEYWRILKPTGIIALTASQPFSSILVTSQIKYFKHEWIWIKNRGGNFANTVREPFKEHEQVLIFSKGKWTYNKQMQERTGAGASRVKYDLNHRSKSENYREFEGREGVKLPNLRVPSSWQKFNTDTSKQHPTIKPVDLFRYLIRTYTNEGEIILDNTAGSGTTPIACLYEKRNYIAIEKEEKYFNIMKERIESFVI
jgi:site-specific DNA-methyltransferase (adenine-specific)